MVEVSSSGHTIVNASDNWRPLAVPLPDIARPSAQSPAALTANPRYFSDRWSGLILIDRGLSVTLPG